MTKTIQILKNKQLEICNSILNELDVLMNIRKAAREKLGITSSLREDLPLGDYIHIASSLTQTLMMLENILQVVGKQDSSTAKVSKQDK